MEAYRSGHNGPDSKSGSPYWARGFESHRFRHIDYHLLMNQEGLPTDGFFWKLQIANIEFFLFVWYNRIVKIDIWRYSSAG